MARHVTEEVPAFFRTANVVSCMAFALEVGLRIYAKGAAFFYTEGYLGNIFDFIVVALQVAEELVSTLCTVVGSSATLLRTLRLLRLIRILRFGRILNLVGPLRMLVISITNSFRLISWILVLLILMTYLAGIFLTEITSQYRCQNANDGREHSNEELLVSLYGSLVRSMITMYQTITDGIHWGRAMEPLEQNISYWITPVFIAYITFAIFAVMNVVTGIFVESSIRQAEQDRDEMVLDQLKTLFLSHDDDKSGGINPEEFNNFLTRPELQSMLAEMQLDPRDGDLLFKLLDEDESGEIEAEELVSGCMRLRGQARSLELAAFMHENSRNFKRWREHADLVQKLLKALVHRAEFKRAVSPLTPLSPLSPSATEKAPQQSLLEADLLGDLPAPKKTCAVPARKTNFQNSSAEEDLLSGPPVTSTQESRLHDEQPELQEIALRGSVAENEVLPNFMQPPELGFVATSPPRAVQMQRGPANTPSCCSPFEAASAFS
eukprot:gnl/TRDRNA2_/TRDRNA2_168913_c0_seq7.p1 gnl/TRDRNA2_/TRDRNA2_168913_c0~~gnl/TRDRNA2_/TRDRNA2_168913_c0_seq7.p1  ORF type:complete len:493 (-),score=69.85 gnl/TRDRNA2_/TRDRNA2_168913_c0_seq7:27-1505(-)